MRRGASHDAPENTLASARLAWAQGADALELDVHRTKDGELVVAHDEDLPHVAGAPRRIDASTLAELQGFDVGRWKGAAFAGEKIPYLGEMLATVPARHRVFTEIKGGPEVVTALVRAVARSEIPNEQIVVITFDRLAARAAKQALPRCEAGWIIDAPRTWHEGALAAMLRMATDLRLDALDFESSWPLDTALVQQIHQFGFKVYAWTVDDPEVACRLAAAGVDGVTRNRPAWLREQLAG